MMFALYRARRRADLAFAVASGSWLVKKGRAEAVFTCRWPLVHSHSYSSFLPEGGARLGLPSQPVAALLAVSLLGAVVGITLADADPPPATGAIQQHVGGGNGELHRQLPALRVAIAGLDVLPGAVDALDDDLVFLEQD